MATFSITLPRTPALLMVSGPESRTGVWVCTGIKMSGLLGPTSHALPALGAPLLKRTPETKRNMERGKKKWRNMAGEGQSESWGRGEWRKKWGCSDRTSPLQDTNGLRLATRQRGA